MVKASTLSLKQLKNVKPALQATLMKDLGNTILSLASANSTTKVLVITMATGKMVNVMVKEL